MSGPPHVEVPREAIADFCRRWQVTELCLFGSVLRDVKGALHDFWNARRVLDLRRPFDRRTEKGAIVHLLKRAAAEHAALDLTDEKNERR